MYQIFITSAAMHRMLNARNIRHLTARSGSMCLGGCACELSIIPNKGKSLSDFSLCGLFWKGCLSNLTEHSHNTSRMGGLGKPPVSLTEFTQYSKMVVPLLTCYIFTVGHEQINVLVLEKHFAKLQIKVGLLVIMSSAQPVKTAVQCLL